MVELVQSPTPIQAGDAALVNRAGSPQMVVLGTAAVENISAFATQAQGVLADSAVQPGDLATVATTGSYTDLTNIPTTFAPSAHTHTISQITDFPVLATVATSGLYSDLSGVPSTFTPSAHTHLVADITDFPILATVATSGSYSDLINVPTTFTPSAHTHLVADITDFPVLATVATSGAYSDLSGLPSLGTISSQNANSVSLTGGTIDGVTIGGTTPATVLNVDNLRLDGNTVSSTDTNGNISLAPNGTGSVTAPTPAQGDNSTKVATTAFVAAAAAVAIPAGSVIWYAANAAPSGYLKANGALVSRSTYATLFAAIGTTFGAGDGSTTFALPDLRGEFLRGWDDGRGVDSGRAFGSAQADDFRSHAHALPTAMGRFTGGGTTGGSGTIVAVDSYSTTSSGGAETRPRNVALLACIKF